MRVSCDLWGGNWTTVDIDVSAPFTTAYLQQMLPGSEMVVFEDTSHEHHLEKTEDNLKVVREFLRDVDEKNNFYHSNRDIGGLQIGTLALYLIGFH